MNFDEILEIRGQQRRKYLENPNFEKLSDTLKVDYERRICVTHKQVKMLPWYLNY